MAALSQIAQILILQKQDQLARDTVNLITEDANRLFALLGIAEAKQKLGEADAALALIEDAAALAETVPQLGVRSSVLNEIALRLIDLGQMDKARDISHQNLELILQIKDESSRAVELANLSSVRAMLDFDLTDEERSLVDRLIRTV
jgi:hypothetical protein